MVKLPEGLSAKRNKKSEALLVEKSRAWIENDGRSPGIHASDLMDPRQAYWSKTVPESIPDRLVNTFLVGKVLHAFVLGAVDGPGPVDLAASDDGSRTSEELGIDFSPDKVLDGVVRELKTSRSFYEPKDIQDLALYIEQILIYMAATKTLSAELWILFLNMRDESGKTAPAYRCYTIAITQPQLDQLVLDLRATRDRLVAALETHDPSGLELCREFKCGARNCGWYDKCQPPGRFGDPRWDALSAPPRVSRAKKAS